MSNFGIKKRQRLAAMLANFSQVGLGTLLLSNFFKEASWIGRSVVILLVLVCGGFSVFVEPEEKENSHD